MKQIKYLLFAAILIFSFVGCSSDDSANQVQEPMGWLNFTINGQIMNGSFSIEDNSNSTHGQTVAVLVPEENNPNAHIAMLNFVDDNQNLMSNIIFPANEGSMPLIFFQLHPSITGYSGFIPEDPMTITITQLETSSSTNPAALFISKIRGNFSGTIVTENFSTGDKFYHTIEGDFYVQTIYN